MITWPSLISDLLDAGMTRAEVAAACAPCGVATLNDLARGTTHEPRHALGERLLALHAKVCKHTSGKRGGTTRKK